MNIRRRNKAILTNDDFYETVSNVEHLNDKRTIRITDKALSIENVYVKTYFHETQECLANSNNINCIACKMLSKTIKQIQVDIQGLGRIFQSKIHRKMIDPKDLLRIFLISSIFSIINEIFDYWEYTWVKIIKIIIAVLSFGTQFIYYTYKIKKHYINQPYITIKYDDYKIIQKNKGLEKGERIVIPNYNECIINLYYKENCSKIYYNRNNDDVSTE